MSIRSKAKDAEYIASGIPGCAWWLIAIIIICTVIWDWFKGLFNFIFLF